MKTIYWGEVEEETPEEFSSIIDMADRIPHIMFRALNRKLNKRGLTLNIDIIPEETCNEQSSR